MPVVSCTGCHMYSKICPGCHWYFCLGVMCVCVCMPVVCCPGCHMYTKICPGCHWYFCLGVMCACVRVPVVSVVPSGLKKNERAAVLGQLVRFLLNNPDEEVFE